MGPDGRIPGAGGKLRAGILRTGHQRGLVRGRARAGIVRAEGCGGIFASGETPMRTWREERRRNGRGEYQDPGRGVGLSRKMAGWAPDKGLTGGGGGTWDLSRGWRPGVSGRRMRAPGLSQDSGRGAEGIRDGDAGKWY